MTDRITVSLDESAAESLSHIVEETGDSQSKIVRDSIEFYARNIFIATSGDTEHLEFYHEMLSKGGHVMLDIDFLHAMLRYIIELDDGLSDNFWGYVDPVSTYHAKEYSQRFSSLHELLDWLSLCGFLTVQKANEDAFHVVFPSKEVRQFMMRFIQNSSTDLPFGIEVEEGVSKVLIRESDR